jgi:hypothetical protein
MIGREVCAMSRREGRGYIAGLGAFRPYPPLVGAGDWEAVLAILRGAADEAGRTGAEALVPRLRQLAGEAAYQAVFRRVGYRWRELDDREWLELVLDAVADVRAVYEAGEPRSGEAYVAQNHAYRAAYAWLAAVLTMWIEAIETRKVTDAGKEDER